MNSDVLINIFFQFDDPLDVLHCFQVCKLWNSVHKQLIWKNLYLKWELEEKSDPGTNVSYRLLMNQVYFSRKIPLENKWSIYNQNYKCSVTHVEFRTNIIRIHFNEQGDNSAGSIQNPAFSTLRLEDHDQTDLRRLTCSTAHFLIADRHKQYLGYLEYCINFPIRRSNVHFTYGQSGYREVLLFKLDELFIEKYRLQHLLDPRKEQSSQFGETLSEQNEHSAKHRKLA